MLDAQLPSEIRQLHVFSWLLTPLFLIALGSYCIDSKNSFCFFPGVPYYNRVLRCNIAYPDSDKFESRKGDLKTIRDWVIDQNPPDNQSSHWWYSELNPDVKSAFGRVASAPQILSLFRTLFG